MENTQLVSKLNNIAQLDIDAVHAYDEALKNIDDAEIHTKIREFKEDHVNHIDNISSLILKFGGIPPEHTKDFKGYLIQGFTSLRSITGTIGALKAMQSNEMITNRVYREALEDKDLPEEVKTILEKNYSDEQRHLTYIKEKLASLNH